MNNAYSGGNVDGAAVCPTVRTPEAVLVDSLLNYLAWVRFMADLREPRRRERLRRRKEGRPQEGAA